MNPGEPIERAQMLLAHRGNPSWGGVTYGGRCSPTIG